MLLRFTKLPQSRRSMVTGAGKMSFPSASLRAVWDAYQPLTTTDAFTLKVGYS